VTTVAPNVVEASVHVQWISLRTLVHRPALQRIEKLLQTNAEHLMFGITIYVKCFFACR